MKTIKVKRGEVDKYLGIFTSKETLPILLDVEGKKFSYMVERNVKFAQQEQKHQVKFQNELIKKRGDLSKEYTEGEKKLLDEFSQKDANGKPVVKNNMYSIPNDKLEDFNIKKKLLFKQFPKDGKKEEDFNSAMDKYMEEEIEIKLYQIKEADLPDKVTARIRLILTDFIIEK